MRRVMSDGALVPKPNVIRRANSRKEAAAYYRGAGEPVEATAMGASSVPVVMGAVVVSDDPTSPLKVGQAVQVKKAGVWIGDLARVKKSHSDGTFDIAVYSKFAANMGNLREELVLTHKPFPSEVKEAPWMAARLEALVNKPPDWSDPYKVHVVREHEGREEWAVIEINKPGFRWEQTVRVRDQTPFEWLCGPGRFSRRLETISGADADNRRKLQALILQTTRWTEAAFSGEIYCGGTKLESCHVFRVHGAMRNGLPLVVIREGQSYDKERWAPIAERPPAADGGCCIMS